MFAYKPIPHAKALKTKACQDFVFPQVNLKGERDIRGRKVDSRERGGGDTYWYR